MNKFNKHHLMDVKEVCEYVKIKHKLFKPEEELFCEEIGDGNINYIFKVTSMQSGKSVVIKQADKFLRSSGRPLDLNRNRIEAEVLQLQRKYAKPFVPEVYSYDDVMCAMVMEDISAYHNLRDELFNGEIYQHFPLQIAQFLAACLLNTSDLVMPRDEKKYLMQKYVNVELCDISEDLVFTEPYNNYRHRNVVPSAMQEFVEHNLYQNELLIGEAAKLRDRFMNVSQALIHGDLHTGSIFVNQDGLKVIDPEFAFYGPMGYDIGNVIGNLVFPLVVRKKCNEQSNNFIEWLVLCISQVYDLVKAELSSRYDKLVTLDLYHNEKFKRDKMNEIMADSIGYAGTEIIRRSIGDTKVRELYTIKNTDQLVDVEKTLIIIGSNLIMNRFKIQDGKALIENIMSQL